MMILFDSISNNLSNCDSEMSEIKTVQFMDSDDIWCKCLVESFEKLKVSEISTTESEDESKNRE